MTGITIRKAKLKEYPQMRDIQIAAYGSVKWSFFPILEQRFRKGREFFALYNNKPIGFIHTRYIGKKTYHVINICVLPEYQNRGVGRMLLIHEINRYKKMNCDAVVLEVRHDNDQAIALYTRMGFIETDVMTNYYDGNIDAIRMRLDLI